MRTGEGRTFCKNFTGLLWSVVVLHLVLGLYQLFLLVSSFWTCCTHDFGEGSAKPIPGVVTIRIVEPHVIDPKNSMHEVPPHKL